MNITLNELRDRAYKCAINHGWHNDNLSDEHCLCLVISELMEAVEADRKDKYANRSQFEYYMKQQIRSNEEFIYAFRHTIKDTVEDEIADACIRLLDLAGLRNTDLGIIDFYALKCSEWDSTWTFTENMYSLVSDITDQRFIEINDVDSHIRMSIRTIIGFCVKKEIDIMWYISQKMKYNEFREYKHGKKY